MLKKIKFELEKYSILFQIDIYEEKEKLIARIKKLVNGVEIIVRPKQENTTEDLFTEINIHLANIK